MNTRTSKPASTGNVEHETLAAALAAFQAELPEIGKANEAAVEEQDGTVRTYRYAGLPDISAAVLPVLGRHGLSFSTIPTFDHEGRFILRYKLRHESASMEGVFPLPDPLATPSDEFGYHVTRARRIALCAVTGVAPGGADEASHAPAPAAPAAPDAPARLWLTEAAEFGDPKKIKALWHELRDEVKAGRAEQGTLDAVAELARQAERGRPAKDEAEAES